MDTFAEFVKEFLLPGSSWFFIIAATGCVALLYGRGRKAAAGRLLLVALVAMYWAMSLPPVARALQAVTVPRRLSQPSASRPDTALPIVVLGNGTMAWGGDGALIDVLLPQTGYNAIRAIELYHQFPASMVIVSGGAARERATPEAVVIREALLKNGVPAERIVLEATSKNTHEQAIEVARILKARDAHACFLATSAEHMIRAVGLFRSEGIEAIPAAAQSQLFSPLWEPSGEAHWWLWIIPSSEARAVSRDVMYELFASVYYRARGWMG